MLECEEGEEGALKPKQTQRLLKCLITARVLGQSSSGNGWFQRLDQEILAVVASDKGRLPTLATVLAEVAVKVTLSRERLSAVELASTVLSAHVDAAAAAAALEAVNGGEFGGWECGVLVVQLVALEGMAHGKVSRGTTVAIIITNTTVAAITITTNATNATNTANTTNITNTTHHRQRYPADDAPTGRQEPAQRDGQGA